MSDNLELCIGPATALGYAPDDLFGTCHGSCGRLLSAGEVAGWHPRDDGGGVVLEGYCGPCLEDLLSTGEVVKGWPT